MKTDITLARQAIRAYPRTEYTDREAVRHLRRCYIKARMMLGDRWLLANQVPRKNG